MPWSVGRRKRPSLEMFWRKVTRNGLARCELKGQGECFGPKQAHHYVEKQHLEDEPYVDVRNGVCLCARHHAQVTNARLRSPRPRQLDDFLQQYPEARRHLPRWERDQSQVSVEADPNQ